MLTWAAAWVTVKAQIATGLLVLAAMGCDVAIVYYITQAIIHH
jgi:hypothetical protein